MTAGDLFRSSAGDETRRIYDKPTDNLHQYRTAEFEKKERTLTSNRAPSNGLVRNLNSHLLVTLLYTATCNSAVLVHITTCTCTKSEREEKRARKRRTDRQSVEKWRQRAR